MELWFFFSLIAVVFSGLHVFMQKVGAARGYNSSLLNSYTAAVSSLLGFVLVFYYENFSEFSLFMVGFSILAGVIYIFSSNLRMDSLKYIDATIFLPLHKFFSPLFALIIGLLLFKEALNLYEWLGIILGMVVPLMLISRKENHRQKNLSKGLLLMIISAVLAAVTSALNKEGTNIFSSPLLFASVSNTFGAIVGMVIYKFRKKAEEGTAETHHFDKGLVKLALITSIIQAVSFYSFMMAFATGGALAIVYTIHSLYIVIPIVLSIIFYHEHWNFRKAVAILLSVLAIGLLG